MKRIVSFLVILVMLLSICGVTAFAAPSPTPKEYHAISVGIKGRGYAETDKIAVEAGTGEYATLTAKSGDDPFIKWEITGTYDLLEGNTSSAILKIVPKSDIVAIAVFKGGEDSTAVISTPDKSPISPKTGQDATSIYLLLALMVICCGGIILSTYKFKKIKD